MALQKNFKYSNGTETNYHKVHEVKLVHESKVVVVENDDNTTEEVIDTSYKISIQLYSYVSKEVRLVSEHNYLERNIIYGVRAADIVENSNIMMLAYEIVKDNDAFADAIDV